ncbi:hypothetical protein QTI33_34265 [Variovorax sp. J22P271]|uniref:hypothetical protein n=1 Tax=Variovorax davisae TaxID=3053515 RepID=UPI002574C0E6|nr:hypothetical protein [Variovorax sp. J22P271]MDM0037235.1 hypothetical protein [Variovorax sp. J22P271]
MILEHYGCLEKRSDLGDHSAGAHADAFGGQPNDVDAGLRHRVALGVRALLLGDTLLASPSAPSWSDRASINKQSKKGGKSYSYPQSASTMPASIPGSKFSRRQQVVAFRWLSTRPFAD